MGVDPTDGSRAATRVDDDDAATRVEAPSGAPDAAPAVEPAPLRIGRYTVLRQLGRGGMGVVYAAYDDELDRKIALKVLGSAATEGTQGKTRMHREAQALAKLSHPNVVQVYEVGGVGNQIFLTMEYVEGLDLKEWQAAQRRPWRQLLEVYLQAGRGLAAAHQAGLVHRDFKPANAIVGDDGRVRVLDFGLARAEAGDPSLSASALTSSAGRSLIASTSSLVDDLTEAGTLLGTPAYMAPEQLHRRPAEPRSDLFSFCVALWEALHGRRPFTARTVEGLREEIVRGPPSPPSGPVPAGISRVLARGLAAAPADRPPSMDALLAALVRAADARRRTYMALGTVAALAATAAAGYLLARPAGPGVAERCAAAGDLAGVWDEASRSAVETAVRATDLPFAAATWKALAPRLDAYAGDLAAHLRRACADRLISNEIDEPHLAAQAHCLERRRIDLVATIGVLRRADAGAVAGAFQSVLDLEDVAACDDREALEAARAETLARRDPARDAEVAAIEQGLAEARAEEKAEHYERGIAIAEPALARAEALGDPHRIARALLRLALLRERAGDSDKARALLPRAYAVAVAVADDPLIVDVATARVRLDGAELRDLSATRAWAEVAAAALARVGDDPPRKVRLLLEAGIGRIEAGALAEGAPLVEEAAALAETIQADEPALHVSALNILASGVLRHQGNHVAAIAVTQRALDLHVALLGPDHPYGGMLVYNLGVLRFDRRDFKAAIADFERALTIREGAHGPMHPEVAQTLNGLAAALDELDRTDEAIPVAERALAIEEARRGADHPELVFPLNNLATILIKARRLDDAERHLLRARAIIEARDLGTNALAALVEESLSSLALARDRPAEALDHLLRSRAITIATLGLDNPMVAGVDTNIAILLLRLGRPAEAAPHLEHALAVLSAAPDSAIPLASARLAEARRLYRRRADRPRALDLARRAEAELRAAVADHDPPPAILLDLRRWIAAPRP